VLPLRKFYLIEKMITYNDYPILLFFSQTMQSHLGEIPFETNCEDAEQFFSNSEALEEMFNYVTAANTLSQKDVSTYYLLSPETQKLFQEDKEFRQNLSDEFFSSVITSQYGALLLPYSGQLAYVVMGKHDTKAVKNLGGNYICVAFFHKNLFIGFKEGLIFDGGLVEITSFFSKGAPEVPYLHLIAAWLEYARKQAPLKLYQSDKIKETIYIL